MTDALQNDNIPNSIVPLVLFCMRDHLRSLMIYGVPEEDKSRALLVKVGRFQENPLNNGVSIAISGGDYEDPTYMDGRTDNPKMDSLTIPSLPTCEIGGGEYWWRRGTINYQTFYVRSRLPEEAAMQYAYDFQGRLIQSVKLTPINALTDDYGEHAYSPVYVEGCTFFESGGNKQYIWRGKLLWRVLTWRP